MKQGVIILSCLVLGLILLWERNSLVRLGLEIQELQKTEKALLQTHQELLIELSSLSSYNRIEEIATTRMGMVRPGSGQVVMVLNDHQPDGTDSTRPPGKADYLASLQVIEQEHSGGMPLSRRKEMLHYPRSMREQAGAAQRLHHRTQSSISSVQIAGGQDTLEIFDP